MQQFLKKFNVGDSALFLQLADNHDEVELHIADIMIFNVYSPLPLKSDKMHGEKGRVEVFMRNGQCYEFELFLTVAECLHRRLFARLKAVCNMTPQWLRC